VDRSAGEPSPPSRPSVVRVGMDEVLRFARQFSVKLKAGLSPEKCLAALANESKGRQLRVICQEMRVQVGQGCPLSLAMRAHPGAFDECVIRLVDTGEKAGNLRGALAAAADYLERVHAARMGLHAAVARPLNVLALVLLAVFIATVILSFVASEVLPASLALGPVSGLNLPDRMAVRVAESVRLVWPFVGVFGACCFLALQLLPRLPGTRAALERLAVKLPLLKSAWSSTGLACFARTVSVQMKAGAMLGDAMAVAAQTAGTVPLREAIARTIARIEAGRPYLEALVEDGFLLRRDVNAVQSAERRGDLAGFMQATAEDYERKARANVGKLKTLTHTTSVIALGVTIVAVVLTLYVPVFVTR
jgi:type II secretory pathway component PulF